MQLTPIAEFISSPELKYAVITKASYEADLVAQSISASPRIFLHESQEMVLLSISKYQVQELFDYVQGAVEYQLTLGTGLVTLLLHSQVLALLADQNNEDE